MFGLGPATKIFVAIEAVDMRKGFEGLYGLVRDQLAWRPIWTPIGLQKPPDVRLALCKCLRGLVGLPGFEPGTSCTPSKRASQAAPQPESFKITRLR